MDLIRLPGVRRIVAAVRRYRTVALVFFLCTVGGTLVYTWRQTPQYQAETTIELRWQPYGQTFPFRDVSAQEFTGYWSFDEFRNTQMEIIQSRNVMQRVIDVLGLSELDPEGLAQRVDVAAIPDSRLIRIRVVDSDPQRAADLANAMAQVYVDVGVESRVKWLQQIIDWLRDRIDTTEDDISRAEQRLYEFQKENNSINLEKDKQQAEREIDALHEQYVEVQKRRVQLEGRLAKMEALAATPAGLDGLAATLDVNTVGRLRETYATLAAERARLAAVYGPKHPKMQGVDNQIEALSEQFVKLARDQIDAVRTELELARGEESRLKTAIQALVDRALERSQVWHEYRDLVDQTSNRRQFYDVLLQRFKEVDITRDLNREQAVVIERARAPQAPFRPNKRLNLLAGLMVALFGGVGLALVWNAFQQTVQNGEDVEATAGIQPLVELAYLQPDSIDYPLEQLMRYDPDAPLAEAFRLIRNHIIFAPQRRGMRTLLFTGAHPLEGKTTVACNVAIAAAQAGRRVLLLDADVRRRSASRVWNLEHETGFVDVLAGRLRWQDVLRTSGVPNLTIMAAGGESGRSAEVVQKEVIERILPGLRQEFDLILMDGSPIRYVADALVLATIVDEAILVVEAGRIHKREIREMTSRLERMGQHEYAIILNKVTVPSGGFGVDGYAYGYGLVRPASGDASDLEPVRS